MADRSTHSYWKGVTLPKFPRLRTGLDVDVLVVGGGMTGISAAYLIKQSGRRVALIERDRCAQQDTGNTTAHLTCVTDLRAHDLVKRFGRDHAQAVWDAGSAAIAQIKEIIDAERIECDFRWVPGYLHATLESERQSERNSGQDERRDLRRELKSALGLGIEAAFVDEVPVFGRPGIRFSNQAIFHPRKYLAGLVRRIPGEGCHVFEGAEAESFEREDQDGPIQVQVGGRTITCDYVVIATDVPLTGVSNVASAALLQSKIAPYTSYVIGAALPAGAAPEASYWDTSDPYYYLRIHRLRDRDYAVFGGLDHKTGQVNDGRARFKQLEKMLHRFLPEAKVDHRWSGQVIESVDGLPLIGETAERQFVATGFSGNGLTFGTLSAIMARDAVCGVKNPWAELFDPNRKRLKGGAWNYLRENLDYPYYMVKDRLAAAEGQSLRSVKRGQGKILKLNGQHVAAHRDANGGTTVVSRVCTHLGCIVHWNDADGSWDCPCHGSRFRANGEVLAGPAESPLQPIRKDAPVKPGKSDAD